ncbi:MAG: tetratricopeptide repeat protein [Candidatus Eisenbacteria bacterium]|nr:tetratricopeptide repeat protein [Candidatus Eisenbacteria bacterium]
MKTGKRRALLFAVLFAAAALLFAACQQVHEDVMEFEKDGTVDEDTRVTRLMNSGKHYLDSELYSQAEEAYREVVRIQPDNKVAYTNLAFAVRAQERYDEAFELYQRYTAKFPDDADGFARLAAAYADREDYANAAVQIQRAIQVDPEDTRLQTDLAFYYEKEERWEEAQVAYEKALEAEPDNEDIQQKLSAIYNKLGKTDELLASQETLLAKDPENARLMKNVARLRVEMEDFGGAAELYARLADLEPDNANWVRSLAVANLHTGDTLAAAGAYERLIQQDPSSSEAFIRLADLQASDKIKNLSGAIQNVSRGLELNPNNARGWCVWGDILEKQKKYEQAIAKFEKAVTLSDPIWSPYAERQIPRQEQLIEREDALRRKAEYEKLEEYGD